MVTNGTGDEPSESDQPESESTIKGEPDGLKSREGGW